MPAKNVVEFKYLTSTESKGNVCIFANFQI